MTTLQSVSRVTRVSGGHAHKSASFAANVTAVCVARYVDGVVITPEEIMASLLIDSVATVVWLVQGLCYPGRSDAFS
jgi:hypothetical protein